VKTRDIFENISFKIKSGTSTAIVGPSGSGKSTIAQLCNRLYDPMEGAVLFDDVNLKSIDLKSLRESIGYVA
jgi:ATP-binding cassette subfamily B protein AbcA/BmrA